MWWRFFMFLSLASETSHDLILGMAITPLLSFNAASSLVSHEYHPMPDELTQPTFLESMWKKKTTLWWCYWSPRTPKFAQRLPQLCWARLRQALRKPFHQLHRFPSKMIQNVCVMIHYRSPRVPPEGHSTIIN